MAQKQLSVYMLVPWKCSISGEMFNIALFI